MLNRVLALYTRWFAVWVVLFGAVAWFWPEPFLLIRGGIKIFFALTMFGRTTKINMLKAGPILFVGLIVLIIAEVILMIFAPGNTTLMIVSAIGLLLFAGMTVYDAQATRAMLEQYSAQGPEMVKKVSILCALNLYLDFVNMFMYILQLLGNRD